MTDSRSTAWQDDPRWHGITRTYSLGDVQRLQGSLVPEQTLARRGANLYGRPFVAALARSLAQAVQQVKAGLKAIYLSGWQVAADANLAGQMYPDQSLYPANSVPAVVRRINQALQRADQIAHAEGRNDIDWFAPIVADAEAGFGGPLNVFELIKAMIEAGAAGVHLEDQLASEKKCGHMGGKVLIPTRTAIANLTAARLPLMFMRCRRFSSRGPTAARSSDHDVDERDHRFLAGERTVEGFASVPDDHDRARAQLCACADLLGLKLPNPTSQKKFADTIHAKFRQLLAYNCSPSFN
jgi:isocitrate lyase